MGDQSTDNSFVERRRFARFKTAVPIALLPEGASVASRTETSELSQKGCYVESNFTLAVGNKLQVEFWINEEKLTANAVISTNHPGFGNGMEFLDMSDEDQEKLKRFLAALPQ
jgi:hypothetical protein